MSESKPQTEEEYDEVVEEVTDDEQDSNGVPTETPSEEVITSSAPSNVPGKVNPSAEVKALKLGIPQPTTGGGELGPTIGTPSGPKPLKAGKNPFEKNGEWSESTFSQITINCPTLDSKCETTNELTRASRPENRYWRAVVRFGFAGFTSDTIRFDNVHIPYIQGATYGDDYAYFRLPGHCARAFAEAGKTKGPTGVNENRVVPSAEHWWKIGNNLGEKIGVAHGGKFLKKPLQAIFASTSSGLTVNLVARFQYKAHTEDKTLVKATTPRSISMEVVRAYIIKLGVDVEPPARTQQSKKVEKAVATSKDVATDSLMEKLSNMGL